MRIPLSVWFLALTALSLSPTLASAQEKTTPEAQMAKEPSCVPISLHVPRAGGYGLERWSDDRLRVATNPRKAVIGPEYWVPVGAYRPKKKGERCILFPDGQSVVYINPESWVVSAYKVPALGIHLVRFIPKSYGQDDIKKADDLIQRIYAQVSYYFPAGLKNYMLQDQHVLVTAGIAGDGTRKEERIFPYPGPHLAVIHTPLDDSYTEEFLARQTAYLFNKMRPREETFKDDPLLLAPSWSDMVAGWIALSLTRDPAARERWVKFSYADHELLTDDDPDTWPEGRIYKNIDRSQGAFGMPPNSPKRGAAIRYANNVLGPLVMLATDGLLQEEGVDDTLTDYVRMIHLKKELTLPNVMQAVLSAKGYETFLQWMKGERIPRKYIDKGLERLKIQEIPTNTIAVIDMEK